MRVGLGLVVVATISVLMALPTTASAQLPVGEANGVRIVRDHKGAIVVVFTLSATRLWRRVAGKRVSVMCERGPEPDPENAGYLFSEEGGTIFRAPKRGRRLRTGDLTRGMDVCEVSVEPRTVRRHGKRRRIGRRLIVTIPLTQRGAVRLDEQARALALETLLAIGAVIGGESGDDRYATSSELVAVMPRLRRPLRLPVVSLASPEDTPPAGSIGYWSDGAQHAAAVVLSASGRRLFLEADADEVVRTNVLKYLTSEDGTGAGP
jgi:hypothetical protein